MSDTAMARMAEETRVGLGSERSGSGGWWLFIALLFGCLRYWKLGEWSLWHDEAITLADAHHAAETGQLYNPLGYLAIRSTVAFLGGIPTEFALRLLPALLGHLAIALCWWAFQPLLGGRRAGFAALLLSVSSWQLYWSQNARFYTMAEVLGLLGGGLLLRAYLRGGVGRALAGALVLALGSWIQLSCVLLFGALIAAPLLPRALGVTLPEAGRRVARRALWTAALGGLLLSPWILDVWSTYLASKGTGQGLGASLSGVAHFLLTTGYFVTPLLGIAFVLSTLDSLRRRELAGLLLSSVALLGCAGAALASLGAVVSAQYVFVLLPWIAAVAARILPPVGVRRERALGASVVVACLLALPAAADSLLYFTQRHGERERWREAWHYVWENQRAGDLVAGMAAPVGEYYLAPGRTDLRHPRSVAWLDKHRARLADLWSDHLRRAWYVIRPDSLATWEADERDAFRERLQRECRLMRRFPVRMEGRDLDVEVWLYEP